MITFEEAYNIVINRKTRLSTEEIGFHHSLNRVLAEDIRSDINMPPFDKSAMDGFACKMADIGKELKIVETIAAGQEPQKAVGDGECSKIMTGAIIPEGADCVLMVEHTEVLANGNIRFTKDSTKSNICYLGEDVKTNDLVLEKGILIQPQHIAIMASVGATNIKVYRKPKVAILSTGDELTEPENRPEGSMIRNSNGHQLIAQVLNINAEPIYLGIVKDTKEATEEAISRAFNEADIVLLTGGVSMGEFDFVPEIMRKLDVNILFQSIAVQPGKPTVFGTKGTDKFIFGLPGNPVSSFMQFELLVKPLIHSLQDRSFSPLAIKMPMGSKYSRKKSVRKSFIPVNITKEGTVVPVDYHGSAHIHALDKADALISIPIGETQLEEGQIVHVRLI